MTKDIYRSYLLVLEDEKEKIIIDFSKIEKFKHQKLNKYKLEHIDYFTRQARSEDELRIILVREKVIDIKQAEKGNFKIYPVKREKIEKFINGKFKKVEIPEYADESLEGIVIAKYDYLFESDIAIINLIEKKLKDNNFAEKFYDKFSKSKQYSSGYIASLTHKIEDINEDIRNARDFNQKNRLEQIRKSYYKQINDAKEMRGLLDSLLFYSNAINRGETLYNESIFSFRNNIREFVLRHKYYVESYKDGLHDNRALTFKLNKDKKRTVSYAKFRDLVIFLITYLEEEELQKRIKQQEESEKNIIEGRQLTLWDIDGFNKKKNR